jgi:hypothetical protein
MSKLYNDSVQVASEKIKWQRDDVASKIVDFEQARHKQSQRQFAIEQAVSRSTLRHRLARKESILIIVEKYVENRQAATWNKVVLEALKDLPAQVIQVASDEGRGLINHTIKGQPFEGSTFTFSCSR